MATYDFSDYFLYKWRYVIGYTAVALLLAGLLVFAGLYVPGGLSEGEIASVITSHQMQAFSWSTIPVIDLPYHALQHWLLSIFGPSVFIVKLPSLIFALLSALGLIALLRKWFKPNIATLASLIAIASGQFLFIAQQGTSDVLYIFWPITILLLGTLVTRQKKYRLLWKVLFGVAVALSLYTPLSIYSAIAVAITIAAHPHLRAILRRLSIKKLLLTAGVSLLLLVPLISGITQDPSSIKVLFGIPQDWPDFAANATLLFKQYFLFWQPHTTTLMTPVFGLGASLLIVIGAWRLIKTLDTTRSYLIGIWFLCLIPVLIINPTVTNVTFTVSVLLIASGLTSVISYWYRLFPRNPYARVSGLVPIIILVVALIGTGVVRYVYGYHYTPAAANLFSHDLKLLPDTTNALVVSEEEQPFYTAIYHYADIDTAYINPSWQYATITVSHAAKQTPPENYKVKTIITNDRQKDADRFYIYTKI